MSIEALRWAWMQEIEPGPKFTLVALADRADEEGVVFPSVKWLMRKTGYGERTVRDHIALLRRTSLLSTKVRSRDDGGQTSNEFYLAVAQPGLRLTPPADSAGGGANPAYPPAGNNMGGVRNPQGAPAATAPHETQELTSRKRKNKALRASFVPAIPDGVQRETWDGFLELRKQKNAPITEYGYKLMCRSLTAMSISGGSPDDAVAKAIMNGWTGIYPGKGPDFRPAKDAARKQAVEDWVPPESRGGHAGN